jgi:geranylgeranyl diphosphate synthase type I
MSFLDTYKPEILAHLNSTLEKMPALVPFKNRWSDDVFKRFEEFSQNGKMFRGALFLFTCKMLGEEITDDLLDIAAAIEILQSSILIHDDVMDNDRKRRNIDTVFVQYEDLLKKENINDAAYAGKNLAICMGDIGFFLLYEIIASTHLPDETKTTIIFTLSREILQVGIAQMSDCTNTVGKPETEAEIISLYTHKTARYTISLPLMLAAIVSKQSKEVIEQLSTLGECVGIIFQIQDELLGLFGDEEKTGKEVGSDIRENRKTLYKTYLYEASPAEEKEKLNAIFGSNAISQYDIEFIRSSVKSKKIYEKIKELEKEYTHISDTIVDSLSIDKDSKEELKKFIGYMSSRSS